MTPLHISNVAYWLEEKKKTTKIGLQKLQDKVPVEFRDRIDQILSETKLSSAELELVNKFGETISGYLSEKGGKQYHIGWVKVCPDCSEGELRTRLNTLESSNPALATSLQNKVQLQPETKLILQEIEQEIGDDRLGEIYEGIEEEIYGKGKDPDPTIPTPTAPTAAEITASKNKANAAISSGDKAQLQAAKTELESLKSRLEAAGVSATEISTLIQSVNTKIQELEGDTAYRQRVISEITAKLTANGISETDLDDASKTKLAALKAGQTSGAEINQAADFIKQAADTAMVTKKVTEFTAQLVEKIEITPETIRSFMEKYWFVSFTFRVGVYFDIINIEAKNTKNLTSFQYYPTGLTTEYYPRTKKNTKKEFFGKENYSEYSAFLEKLFFFATQEKIKRIRGEWRKETETKRKEVKKLVQEKFQHSSPMQTTDIEKIVLNSGVGQAIGDKKFLEKTQTALTRIAQGQKSVLTYARKSITTFKLREGMEIGCVSTKKFDWAGNYSLGIDNLNIFPTVPYDLTFKNQGMQITIVFKSALTKENIYFLSLLGFPFKEKEILSE
ncbi:10707_t:CDS:2 [Funneliformis geosporum]|uniref:10707_t:CDS:1 n=1 Tax=Funneliformis geosporum TaxID=1117311 RepID=A0A9W4SAP5_9GLOM|nr:10707_t:CDS:2 [Funneliformis geosporum]